MTLHSSLTGSECHEPKGANTSGAGRVYVADGSGSGSWKFRPYTLVLNIDDIASSGDIYIPIPYAGNVAKVQTTLSGAIAGSDVIFTVYDSNNNSMGTLTITQSGSAAGDTDTLVPASNQDVTGSDYVKISCNGGATAHVDTTIVVCVEGT